VGTVRVVKSCTVYTRRVIRPPSTFPRWHRSALHAPIRVRLQSPGDSLVRIADGQVSAAKRALTLTSDAIKALGVPPNVRSSEL
jgi:hypothetical protein